MWLRIMRLAGNPQPLPQMLENRRTTGDDRARNEAGMVDEALFEACKMYVQWQQAETKALPTPLPTADITRRYDQIREYFGGERVAAFM